MADVKNPPAGGFEEGGWYWDPSISEARQYSGGSFGGGTTINNPNQQGYGERVSEEVQAQSNPLVAPTSKEEVTPFLQDFQSGLYGASTSPDVKIPTMDELKDDLAPDQPAPTLLNRTEEFAKFRDEYGVQQLEDNLNDLKAQEEEAYAQLKINEDSERGKPVAMNVIEGRMSEQERIARDNIEFIQRQKSRVVDELNTKYNVIGQMMEFMSLDYQDATKAYDTEFKNNLSLYSIISGKEELALSQAEKDRTAARANLQIYSNAITNGNIS